MKVFLSAGEVSGDIVGARLASELLHREPTAVISGVGGDRMRAAGVRVLADANHLGTIGVTESFRVIPSLFSVWRSIRTEVRRDRPDVAVLIGNDIFNVLLGRWLRANRIHTVALFPPQIWIWRAIAWLFAGSYDTILACFPEEREIWSRYCRSTFFVGHHLADVLDRRDAVARSEARTALKLSERSEVIALLPGSREQELDALLPSLIEAASRILVSRPDARFVVPVAHTVNPEHIAREIARAGLGGGVSTTDDSHAAMRAADLILLASGTATLEAALLGVPMIVVYRISRVSMAIVRSCIRVGLIDSETIALPNLLLGREVVPEIRQERLSAEALASAALTLLDSPVMRQSMIQDLAEVRGQVFAGGSVRLAADRVQRIAAADEEPGVVQTALPVATEKA